VRIVSQSQVTRRIANASGNQLLLIEIKAEFVYAANQAQKYRQNNRGLEQRRATIGFVERFQPLQYHGAAVKDSPASSKCHLSDPNLTTHALGCHLLS